MKWRVAKFGKVVFPEIRSLAEEYQKRLTRFASVQFDEIKVPNDSKKFDCVEKLKLPSNKATKVILLDETGKKWSTKDLAKHIKNWNADGHKLGEIVFVIGPPFGADENLKKRADLTVSLSDLTFTSDMSWLILTEQLYRAFSLIAGSPYHHE